MNIASCILHKKLSARTGTFLHYFTISAQKRQEVVRNFRTRFCTNFFLHQPSVPADIDLFDRPCRDNIERHDADKHDPVFCRRRRKIHRLAQGRQRKRRQHDESAGRQCADGKRGTAGAGEPLRAQQMQHEHLRTRRLDKPARPEERGKLFLPGRAECGVGCAARVGADRKEQR